MKFIIKSVILIVGLSILSACNQSYDSNEAIKRGDIVDLHGQVSNLDRLDKFINNIETGTKDKIRLTRYTEEGDPIYYDFTFDGNKVKYKYDNSNDKHGSSKIKSSDCMKMKKENEGSELEFKLEGCTGENADFGNQFSFKVTK